MRIYRRYLCREHEPAGGNAAKLRFALEIRNHRRLAAAQPERTARRIAQQPQDLLAGVPALIPRDREREITAGNHIFVFPRILARFAILQSAAWEFERIFRARS